MKKSPRGPSNPPDANKPFCDCIACKNKACPDIMKMISLPSTERAKSKTKEYTSKTKRQKLDSSAPINSGKTKRKKSKDPQHPSLMDVMNEERDCACEVMARAVAPHTHKNLGMEKYRQQINKGQFPPDVPNTDTENQKYKDNI